MAKKKKTYNPNRIKATLAYSVNEIAELYSLHKRTVQQWLKDGLPRIDNKKPYLIMGADLKTFIKTKRSKARQKCKAHELFCCKCRKPQKSWENIVDIKVLNERQLMIMGICPECNTKTNRASTVPKLKDIQEIFCIQTIHNKHLIEFSLPIVNTYINKEIKT